MYSRKLALAAVSAIVLTVSAGAQTSKGILTGIARDTTGAVLPNANVTVKDQDTGESRTTTTKSDGAYRVEAISPGKYTITVVLTGFTTSEVKDVTVASSAVTSYDVTLSVGGTSTEVSVEANQATLNTDNGTLTGVVSAIEIDKLPIFSLNPIELATTIPGVQTVSNGGGFSNGINIQVNGSRPRDNNFLLDGQEINDVGIGGQAFQPQIPDIFDSLNVITNSASAEYGRAGGGIVNLITKQGTNAFHGEVFERYTGSGLNSIPGGLRGPDTGFVKTRYDEHSYGFVAGGPIIKDKLFAFGALELQRYYGQETPGINLLPDAAGYATLQGITGAPAAQVQLLDGYLNNGAYLTQDIIYPATSAAGITRNVGSPCPGARQRDASSPLPASSVPISLRSAPIPSSCIASTFVPGRRTASASVICTTAPRSRRTSSIIPTRSSALTRCRAAQPSLEKGPGRISLLPAWRMSSASRKHAWPSPSLPRRKRWRTRLTACLLSTSQPSPVAPLLEPSAAHHWDRTRTFPRDAKRIFTNFRTPSATPKAANPFRIGADIGRLIEIDIVSQNAIGTLNFNTGGSGACGTDCTSLGNFLLNQLGPSGSATKTFGQTRADSHGYRNGFFAQDDIKFTPDLTLNFGVRYDYLSNPENSLKYPGVNPDNVYAPINTVVRINNDYNNISPRIGFAYSPHTGGMFGNGKMVVRGGFGIFYDSTFSNILVNSTQSLTRFSCRDLGADNREWFGKRHGSDWDNLSRAEPALQRAQ